MQTQNLLPQISSAPAPARAHAPAQNDKGGAQFSQALSREISQRLDLSMKTVDAHRRHMREKLNLRSTSELIRYATQWVSDRGAGPGLSHGSA